MGRHSHSSSEIEREHKMAVTITRLDASAIDLRETMARTRRRKSGAFGCWQLRRCWKDARGKAAAEACAMDRQTLRDWVHRYNDFRSRAPLSINFNFLLPACRPSSRLWFNFGSSKFWRWSRGQRGALALRRFAAADCARVRGLVARAHGWQAGAQVVVPAAVGASAAPRRKLLRHKRFSKWVC